MSIPAMASHNEFAPKYNAIKLMFAGGVCGAAQTAFIHAEHLNNVEGNTGVWRLSEGFATIQYGSGQQHQAWIFVRAQA